MASLPYKNPERILPVLILVAMAINLARPLKIYAPGKPPPKSTSAPRNNSGFNLPYIYVLNGTAGDIGGDPMYYSPTLSGSSSFIFQNDTVYVVPGTRNVLTFQCEARYPVFWNLAHSKIHPSAYSALRVFSKREFVDPFDTTTFKYVTILTMNGPNSQLTGKYSCQSGARHEIASTVYVFWESSFGSVLVLSKQNLTINVQSEKEEIHLPCHVTDPDIEPKLIKLRQDPGVGNNNNNNNINKQHVFAPPIHPPPKQPPQPQQDEKLGLNDSIAYSPMTGFNLKNLPSPFGTYKCSVDPNDYVFIQVVRKNDTTSNPSTSSEPKYTFQYDEDSKQIHCCAKMQGRKPPKIYLMMCEHPSTCGLREFIATDSTSWYPWNQGKRRGSCSVLSLKSMHTGIIRCIGDGGFNVYKEFIVPVRVDPVPWNQKRNTTTYFRWEEIDPQEMIAVGSPSRVRDYYLDIGIGRTLRKSQLDQTIYSKQTINLECHMSRYYFASGNYWMIRWKNQTMSQLTDGSNSYSGGRRYGRRMYYDDRIQHLNYISFEAHSEMESVMCFAPVWNSSTWITKIHYLYVNESTSPLLLPSQDVNETVHYTWYANETEKILSCSASGLPGPTFHWEKDNGTILDSSHNFQVLTPNVTSAANSTTTTTAAPTTTSTSTTASPTGGPTDSSLDGGSEDNQKDDNNNNSKRKWPKVIPVQSLSSLRINRVSYSTQGVFRCVATNFGGKVTKEFHITVLEAKSWSATIFFVISCVLTVGLMIGIIFLLRRLHKDRQEINQLTGNTVNFQNGGAIRNNGNAGGGGGGGIIGIGIGGAGSSSSSSAISTSTSKYQQHHNEEDSFHNSISFDNGKMTNNLIDAF